jgi:hypothetical protein
VSRDTFSFDPQDARDTESRSPDTGREARSTSAARAASPDSKDLNRGDVQDFPQRRDRKPEAMDSRQAYYLRDRTYFVRDSEFETLAEIGMFRVVAAGDLARFGYKGGACRMERELRHLKQQRLLSERTITTGKGETARIFTLTKTGKRLVEKSGRLPDTQAVYHGLVKPREAKHDAELYRLYQKETARIADAGGRPLRVVLDYELKRNLNRDLAALGHESDALAGRESESRILHPCTARRCLAPPPHSRSTRNYRGDPFPMNIAPVHVTALEALGYTDEEARFLYLVATHSGYFVAGQFLAFAGAQWGKRTTLFWNKLHSKKHASTGQLPKHGAVYHLFAPKVYRQIGRENLRNRRQHEIEYIRTRIAMLDFVLGNPEFSYLETEADKFAYFNGELKVGARQLPSKTYLGPVKKVKTTLCTRHCSRSFTLWNGHFLESERDNGGGEKKGPTEKTPNRA